MAVWPPAGALRARLAELGADLAIPPAVVRRADAAMIAAAALHGPQLEHPAYLGLDAYPTARRVA